ncbi:u3 small nucleolar rna-associated protein 4 [Moniliophthora roreri MCA 2997]|uniref:U3 small nucleolar rna-associated protein 4 n=1 Tax=Moniliophthora roreri (strain MCA 2997) TaxID=1381753 RepID=V2Z387_MONRO|nr:u3 small nucleolar rna-associated protein 4 [Moniliophthora roreri MCA 2997]
MPETSVAVHRCRFVDYNPSAITALAFPPIPLPPTKKPKSAAEQSRSFPKFGTLAVGHANGNIDLCEWTGSERDLQSHQGWTVTKSISGLYPSKVDSLVFILRDPDTLKYEDVPTISDLRLFSSGGGSDLIEWNMEHLCIRRTINSQGGSIWCVAANPTSTMLALGCEDGTVRLVSVSDDTLIHYRRFDRVKCRILSLTWGPPVSQEPKDSADSDSDDEGNWLDSWIVTGCSDSSLRKWDVSTGRVLDRMGTDKIRGERTLVWAVAALGDGTIVSGDSLGIVKFWDSRTSTQLHSFQAHNADVLCLAVGPEGNVVYSTGVDQKTTQFSQVKTFSKSEAKSTLKTSSRWVQSSSRRMHSHDVRALSIWPPHLPLPPSHRRHFPSDIAPVLASGGLDMSVVVKPAALPSSTAISRVVNPLATSVDVVFEDSYHRRLPYPPGPSSNYAVHVARRARLVSCMQDASLTIWRVLKTASSEEEVDPDAPDWEKCLEMEFDVHTNLVATALSDDGQWLVVSDMYEMKLFALNLEADGIMKPRRIRNFPAVIQPHIPTEPASRGGLAFAFTPDSTKLVMTTAMSSYVLIIELDKNDKPSVLRKFGHHRQSTRGSRAFKDLKTTSNDDEDDTLATLTNANILRIAISADGQWLATSDDKCRTHVFNLDTLQHHCSLPSFPLPAQSLAFDPSRPSHLLLAFPNNSFQIYDVETRQFPAWSRELSNHLPRRFTTIHDALLGVAFAPVVSQSSSRFVVFWGATWLCKIPLDDTSQSVNSSRKRRRESIKEPSADSSHWEHKVKMITQYRPLLLVDFVGEGELIVVERPLVDVLATLPPAFFKHKYGAS